MTELNYTLQGAFGTGPRFRNLWDYVPDPPTYAAPLAHSQTHTFSALFSIQTEKDDGPEILGVRPLANVSAVIHYEYGSGFHYSKRHMTSSVYNEYSGGVISGMNGLHMPPTSTLNCKIYKTLSWKWLRWIPYLQVTNMLNHKNILWVYPTTGSPDSDGWLIMNEYCQRVPSNVVAWYRARNRNPAHYGPPRQIRLGIRLGF